MKTVRLHGGPFSSCEVSLPDEWTECKIVEKIAESFVEDDDDQPPDPDFWPSFLSDYRDEWKRHTYRMWPDMPGVFLYEDTERGPSVNLYYGKEGR